MGILEILVAAYAILTAAAGVMTWREQRQAGGAGIAVRAAGLAACAIWPAMLALVLVLRQRQGQGTA